MENSEKIKKNYQKETVFGPGTVFRGVLRFKENLRIKGHFEGTIKATGSLIVDVNAVVKANRVSVSSLYVNGTVDGTIEVVDAVEMAKGSVVRGDVTAKRIKIADGVLFDGQVSMIGVEKDVRIFSRPSAEIKRTLLGDGPAS